MEARRADELRARVLALHAQGLKAREIATAVGCARSTVYKVLRQPGPDKRRTRTGGKARLRELKTRVVALAAQRALEGGLGGAGVGGSVAAASEDPYADLAGEDYLRALRADPLRADTETAYARTLLRWIFDDLKANWMKVTPMERDRLLSRAATLLQACARLQRTGTRSEDEVTGLREFLTAVSPEVLP